jgi:hypothetical protein
MTSVIASRSVPRPTKKLKEGESHQVHVWLPAETIKLIDRVAEDLGSIQRTAALKVLISEALRARGMLK